MKVKQSTDQIAGRRNNAGSIIKTTVLCVAAILSVHTATMACPLAAAHSTIFLDVDDIPQEDRASFVAQVKVIRLLDSGKKFVRDRDKHRASYEGIARVDRIIKGSIDGPVIKLKIFASDCTFPFTVGASGIVAGNLIRDSQGIPELQAIYDSKGAKDRRRQSKTK
jgi:hypothetical protein